MPLQNQITDRSAAGTALSPIEPGACPDLKTLVENLSWSAALLDCCQAWLDAGCARLEQQLRKWVDQNEKFEWLFASFLDMPVDRRREFLLIPPVSSQLLEMDAGRPPTFDVLARELIRVLARSSSSMAADPNVAQMLRPLGSGYADIRGIPVDFDSQFPFPFRGPHAKELRALPPERVTLVQRRIETALDALQQANPVASSAVCLLTRRLAMREEPLQPESPGSSSFGELIGLTLLVNPLAERGTTSWLVDALVHEAIHAALFYCELGQGTLLFGRDPNACLRSPWTTNMLRCDQYVHACFVWFGLSQLWKNWPAGAGGLAPEELEKMHHNASRGFSAQPVSLLLSHEVGRRLLPSVAEALMMLQQFALSDAPAS